MSNRRISFQYNLNKKLEHSVHVTHLQVDRATAGWALVGRTSSLTNLPPQTLLRLRGGALVLVVSLHQLAGSLQQSSLQAGP